MTNVIEMMTSLYPVSDDTIQLLKDNVTLCHFPKKYQLIKANQYSRSAYFIEKGMTRSYWLVNGEEITTSFSCEGGIVFSMDELYYGEFYQFNLSSCIRQQNSLTAQFVSFSLSNLANIFYPPNFYNN